MSLSKPFVYGKYVILDRLAVGGMAEVFRAKTFGVHGFQRMLVIKRILPHLSKDEEFVDMFIDEAKIAVSLTHANICQVTDLGKIDDNYFIAMEYVNGKDLRAIMKKCYSLRASIGIDLAIYITSEVCKGLDYAHRREDPETGQPLSVIHRDISPQNIMISYHGEVKIVDFGIAKTEYKIHRTQAGVLKGKFAYMSPEQSLGQELSTQTDIFSLGIILYEMLANQRLFLGSTDFETLENIKRCEIPPLREINPLVSAELEAIVLQSLEKDTSKRYATAGAMQNALSKVLYSEFPHFTQDLLSKRMASLFDGEIKKEGESLKKTLELVDAQKMGVALRASEMESSHPTPAAMDHFKMVTGSIQKLATQKSSKLAIAMIAIAILSVSLVVWRFAFPPKLQIEEKKHAEEKNFRFEIEPAGAIIKINGQVRATAPADIILPLNQTLNLEVEKDGYQTLQTQFVTDPNNPRAVFSLLRNEPTVAVLEISTQPPGAEVTIDGEPTGQSTPAKIDGLSINKEVQVSLTKEGYKTFYRKVNLTQSSQNLTLTLVKEGPTLKINPVPADATILLDGKKSENLISDLTIGKTYILKVEAPGYQPSERKIILENDYKELDIVLTKKTAALGTLEIQSDPWTEVSVDGKVIGTTPIVNYSLPAGKHEVILRNPGFPERKYSVDIKANSKKQIIVNLHER